MAAYTFNATSGSLSVTTNWTPNGTPGAADSATIPAGKTANAGTCAAGTVTVNGSITNCTFSGAVTYASGSDWGTGNVFNGSVLWTQGCLRGTQTFNGPVVIDTLSTQWYWGLITGGGSVTFNSSAEFKNHATVDYNQNVVFKGAVILRGGCYIKSGTFQSTSSLTWDGGQTSNQVVFQTSNLTFNSGVADGQGIVCNAPVTVPPDSGIMRGTWNGLVTVNGGWVNSNAEYPGGIQYISGTCSIDGVVYAGDLTLNYGDDVSNMTIQGNVTVNGGTFGSGNTVTGTKTFVMGSIYGGTWDQDIWMDTNNGDRVDGWPVFNGRFEHNDRYGVSGYPVFNGDVVIYGGISSDMTINRRVSVDGINWLYSQNMLSRGAGPARLPTGPRIKE